MITLDVRWRSKTAYVVYCNTFMLASVPTSVDLNVFESELKLVCVGRDVYIGESDSEYMAQGYANVLNSACWDEPYEEGEYINEYYTVRREGVLLKPCKYCGVFSHDYLKQDDEVYSVYCFKCGASTQRYGELQLACKAWNDEMVYQIKEMEDGVH